MSDRLPMSKSLLFFVCVLLSHVLTAQASFFTFSYPGPNTIAVGSNCKASLTGKLGTPQVASTVGATITFSVFNPGSSGYLLTDEFRADTTILVFWNVSDNAGHTHNFSFPITFKDFTAPVINTAGLAPNATYATIAQVPVAPTLSAVDNCTPSANLAMLFTQSPSPVACQMGVFTRTWEATDASGNKSTFTQTVNILGDNVKPTITGFPSSTFQTCNPNNTPNYQAWLNAQLSVFAATDASGTPTYSNNAPQTYPFPCAQPLIVTFTATDLCGNQSTATAQYGTNDFVKPTITNTAKDSIVFCTSNGAHTTAIAKWINQRAKSTATDQCTPSNLLVWSMFINGTQVDSAAIIAQFSQSITQACAPKTIGGIVYTRVQGLVDVDFYVSDLCGNIEHAEKATFAAIDTTKPQLLPSLSSIYPCLGANNPASVQAWVQANGNSTATDFCGAVTWLPQYHWLDQNGNKRIGNKTNGPFPVVPLGACSYLISATFYAQDACGNLDSITAVYQMQDQEGPVFTNILQVDTFSCLTGIPTSYTTSVTDNCTGTVVPTYTLSTLSQPCPGTTIYRLNWTATDVCGITSTSSSTVVLSDKQGPQWVTVPKDTVIKCTQFVLPASAIGSNSLSAIDNCSPSVTYKRDTTNTQNPNPSTCAFSNYAIRVRYTATDACNNTSTTVQNISVIDTIGPVFTGFKDTLVGCSSIADPLTANFTLPTAKDACNQVAYPIQLIDRRVTAGSCADNYDLTIRWKSTDICGNTDTFTQKVFARDTVAPALVGIPANLAVDCIRIPVAPMLGSGIFAADNCDDLVSVILNETEIRVPDSTNCAHYSYELKREWIASDNCGNLRAYTQTLMVRDSTPPLIICHPSISVPNLSGQCHAFTNLPYPLASYDECSSNTFAALLTDSMAIRNTSGLPSNNTAVDTMRFAFASPNFSDTWPASTTATVQLLLTKADAEQPDEHYKVYGEQNILLGITSPVSGQCGNGLTTLFIGQDKLNAWLMDGNLQITLIPNGQGPTAINALCGGDGRVKATIAYSYVKPIIPISLSYQIGNGAMLPFPPPNNIQLAGGSNKITYQATDCSGNKGICSLDVQILDTESPTLATIDTIRAYSSSTTCIGEATLKVPSQYQDNCGLKNKYTNASQISATKFTNDPNAGQIPADITHSFMSTPANSSGSGTLSFKHIGDHANIGEFFTILSENNSVIGRTTLSQPDSQCIAWLQSDFIISPDSIKAWATDGIMNFKAVANKDAASFNDFIHPCGTLGPQMLDTISKWQMALSYHFADFDYTIKNDNGQVIESGNMSNPTKKILLTTGRYTVIYALQDQSSNIATRQTTITVSDTTPPVAICKNQLVPVDIGNGSFTLSPSQISFNSTDNCGIVDLSLSRTQFTCNQSGTNTTVTLTATDAHNNKSTCDATVQIQTSGISPSYLTGVCAQQSLELYANPTNDPGQTFSYLWTGPNNFSSLLANPIILAANANNIGTYTVTASNINGCSTTASIFVSISNTPQVPTIQKNKQEHCVGDQVILTTQALGSPSASYLWYSGMPGQSTFLGTSTSPRWEISGPTQSQTDYYVIVRVNNCPSAPSAPVRVTINPIPTAQITNVNQTVCAGSPLSLSVSNFNPSLSYQWIGPNFSALTAQANVTGAASAIHAGNYQLVATSLGCSSLPAISQVQVQSAPQQPALSVNSPLCIGQQIQFASTATGVTKYHWVSPLLDTFVTSTGAFMTSSLTQMSGNWRLFVSNGNCKSMTSQPAQVIIEQAPALNGFSNSPVCTQGILKLNVTTPAQTAQLNYRWTGPSGFVNNLQNPLTNPVAGNYIVTASTLLAGCVSFDTVSVSVVNNPIITSLSSNAPLCATGTTNTTLSAVVFPPNPSYQYLWTGPNGFTSTQATPTIPNVSSQSVGQYQLRVSDTIGCASEIKTTTLSTIDAPPIAILNPVVARCAGTNLEIIIQNTAAYQGNIVSYIWHIPTGGTVTTTNPSYQKVNTTTNDAGLYWVEVMIGNCVSLPSAQINVQIDAIPPTPVISSNFPICEGDTLEFNTNANQGSLWEWFGPSGFASALPNPFIANVVSSVHSGIYTTRYQVNGCKSMMSDPVLIDITNRPSTPVLATPTPVCIDHPNSVLTLSLKNNTSTPFATYQYYQAIGNQPIGAPLLAPQFTLSDLSAYSAGQSQFYVIANLDGCKSLPSALATVQFDTIPNALAFAGQDQLVCILAPITLQSNGSTGTGIWSQPSGQSLTINSPNQASTTVIGALAGNTYSFFWVISNGGCINYSKDTVSVTANAFEQAESIDIIDSCFAFSAKLSAKSSTAGARGFWTQPNGQSLLNVTIADIFDPNTNISGLQPGKTYSFVWNLPDMGCGATTDSTLVRSIGTEAVTEPDRTYCAQLPCGIINATSLLAFESGIWSSQNPDIAFTSATASQTEVCNLALGKNLFVWTTNNGKCGDRSIDSLIVDYEPQPIPRPDTISVPYGRRVEFSVLTNDTYTKSAFSESLINAPKYGKLEKISEGIYRYTPRVDADNMDFFSYELCNVYCPDSCQNAVVILKIEEPSDCRVPTVMTPNDDEVNDTFFIPCFEGDSNLDNEVTIFNSNGQRVYHAEPYLNNWGGIGTNGRLVTAGTYFYIIRFNGGKRIEKGFLEMKH
jgi:gliding motility-associated-like protein